jgi:DUF4097 and DUF4098 domain-containing protein YvlB
MKAAFFAVFLTAGIALFPAIAEETTIIQIPAGEIFSGIKINAAATNAGITIVPAGPGETAVLQMREVKGGMRFSGGTMIVEVQSTQTIARRIFGFGIDWHGRVDTHPEITLRLPLNSLDSVDLETSNGWIHIEDMSFTGGTLVTINGAIRLENTNFSGGSLTTVNGAIRLTDTGWDTLNARSSNGAVDISGGRAGNGSTSVRSSNGRVHLGILGDEDDFSYTITTGNGSIEVNGERQRGTNRVSGGNGAHRIRIQTSNSRANLEFEKEF